MGKKGESDAEKIAMGQHFRQLIKKSEGLLSEKTCDEIKSMLWFAAWHTANTRVGYKSDAQRDKRQVNEHFENIIRGGEIQKELATHVKELGWSCAWLAANTMKKYEDDAVRDKANVDSHFEQIKGEINLVDMKFSVDDAKVLTSKPKSVGKTNLINNSDIQQVMAFKFSVTEGTTTSISDKLGFSFGIKMSFSAGFFGVAEEKYELSLNFSRERTFTETISSSTTKAYEFPLAVPAHTTYKAEATVHEAEMDVPYELVFDFGGARKSMKGRWKGVAVSTATYKVEKICV